MKRFAEPRLEFSAWNCQRELIPQSRELHKMRREVIRQGPSEGTIEPRQLSPQNFELVPVELWIDIFDNWYCARPIHYQNT